jgi:MFS family permease
MTPRLSLLRIPRFKVLFLATFASGFGNWLALIALQVEVYDRTHSGWWVGGLLMVNVLPSVFIGVLFGPLVDRLSRKALMIASDLGRLAVFVALPFVGSPAAVVALAGLAGIGNAFFRPAVLAGLPNLIRNEDLPAANALLQLVDWGTTAVGPLAGGAIVAASGPHLAYWVNAVTFAFSAVLVGSLPGRYLQSDRPIGRGHWADLADGYRVVRESRSLMCVLVAWSIAMLAYGFVNVAEIFLAKVSYKSGDLGFGLLWTGSGIGLVIGGLAASTLITRDLGKAYVRFLALFAVGVACAAAAPNVWIGALAMVLAGMGNGAAVVGNITFVQRSAPDRVRGRALTLLMSANYGAVGLAFIAAGPVTNALGARWAYGLAAGAIAVATGVAWLIARGVELEVQPAAA